MRKTLFISVLVAGSFLIVGCAQEDPLTPVGEDAEQGIVDLSEAEAGVGDDMEVAGDNIADIAEDIAILMTLKKIDPIKSIKEEFKSFIDKNMSAVESVHKIILIFFREFIN